VVKDLLASLIARGVSADDKTLFVIDGSKALRSAIQEMFGESALVQRCRTHYADLRIMPTRCREALAGAVNALARSA
jgi:putative transposase